MKKPIIIHPLLFAIYPVIFVISNNLGQYWLHMQEILSLTGAILGIAIVGWLILQILIKDTAKTGLIVSLYLFIFFSYGHFYRLMDNLQFRIGPVTLGENKLLFGFCISLMILLPILIIKTRIRLIGINRIVNVIAITLVLIPLGNIILFKI